MIAALKRGKTFANESSSAWMIGPADSYETESTIKKLAERAKTISGASSRNTPAHPGLASGKIDGEFAVLVFWQGERSRSIPGEHLMLCPEPACFGHNHVCYANR